jgi:hypothetical protein
MNNAIINKQLTEDDVLSIERLRTPESTRLQKNILQLTQSLPQYTGRYEVAQVYSLETFFDKVGLKKVNFWSLIKPYAATVAAGLAVVALSSTLWLPTQDDALIVTDINSLTSEQLADEIAWQDLMLLNDELAFAGL